MSGKQALAEQRLAGGFHIDPNKLTIIGLDTDDGPEHPLYDKRVKLPIDHNLGKAMMHEGFRGTIEVRKNGKAEDGTDVIEVVFGRQRVKAARWANEQLEAQGKEPILVACLVRKFDDGAAFGVRIGENVHRQGLSTLERADELKRYMAMGNNEDQAAVTFGLSKNGVKNLMRLHDLDGEVRKAVEAEDLSPSAAAELADLSREEQKVELKKLLEAASKGVKATRQAAKKSVKARNGGEKTVAPPKRFITNILKLNDRHGGILNGDVVKGIMWALGDIQSVSIKGLTGLERELEEIKSGKADKKKPKSK